MALPWQSCPQVSFWSHYQTHSSQWIRPMLDAESFVPHRKDTQNVLPMSMVNGRWRASATDVSLRSCPRDDLVLGGLVSMIYDV